MNILLCEDDANIATITRLALEQVGQHKVTWVTDGEEALAQGLGGAFDLILLDDMMPKMSGVAVCAAYKKSAKVNAPVIFLSANPQQARVNELRPVAIGYIPKPFDPLSICDQIDGILKSNVEKAG